MKKNIKQFKNSKIRKVVNIFHLDETYFTDTSWENKNISGVIFMPVSIKNPKEFSDFSIKYIRKDSLRFIE